MTCQVSYVIVTFIDTVLSSSHYREVSHKHENLISYYHTTIDQCRLDMTENDIKTGKELMKEDFIRKNKAWTKELEIMVRFFAASFLNAIIECNLNHL